MRTASEVQVGTHVGVLRLSYVDDGPTTSGLALISSLAALHVLYEAAARLGDVTYTPVAGLDRWVYLASYVPGTRLRDGTQAAVTLGTGALAFAFSPKSSHHALSAEEIATQAHQAWNRPASMPPTPIAGLSKESPFEIVIVATLEAAAAVTSFAILVEAIRRVYRGVRGFALDSAEIDAAIASLNAHAEETVVSSAVLANRMHREAVLADVEELKPTLEQLKLDGLDASIEER